MDPTVAPPPPGFDTAPPMQMQAPEALPPPPGFDVAPPPPGFTVTNPLQPNKASLPEKPNTEVPGFWNTIGSSFSRGVVQRTMDDIAGAKVTLPSGMGGKTLEETYQEGLLAPETKDEIDALLGKKVNEGWTDPKWWGAQLAHGAGGSVPAVGAAAVGALARVPLPASLGIEAGIGTIVPAYKKAREAGLDPDSAVHRAIIDSGISSTAAVAMGLAPGISVFGKNTAVINDQVATMLKRPVSEMLVQLGVIQPGLAIAGELATTLTHPEEKIDPWQLATTGVIGVGQGVPIVGAHAAIRSARRVTGQKVPNELPAGPEAVQQSFENQAPPKTPEQLIAERAEGPPPPEGFVANEMELATKEDRIFFSKLRQVAEKDLPDNASAEQVIATLRNKGVRDEEMIDAGLPAYLADPSGKVNKADLIAHLEANAIELQEVTAAEPPYLRRAQELAEAENGRGSWDRIGGGGQEHYIRDARRELQLPFVERIHALEALYDYNRDAWPDAARLEYDHLLQERQRVLNGEVREPVYSNQVLPGPHSNYREVILKVPPRGEKVTQELDPTTPRGWQSIDSTRDPFPTLTERDNFLRSHFPDPNIIAHARLTDRTGQNGERLLHVEEAQSDAHQKGRRDGYVDPTVRPIEQLRNERIKFNVEHEALREKYPELFKLGVEDLQRLQREGKIPPDLQNYFDRRKPHSEEYNRALSNEGRVADLPFKTAWQELLVKRILRMAADEGYDGVSWANGDQVGLRLKTPEQLAGARVNYGTKLTSLFGKWAKKMGADVDSTVFSNSGGDAPTFNPIHIDRLRNMGLDHTKMNNRNFFVRLNPAAGSRIRQGFPLYDKEPVQKGGISLNMAIQKGNPKALKPHIAQITAILGQLGKDMKISRPIEFEIGPRRTAWRGEADARNGKYIIRINTRLLKNVEDFYATAVHELGHVIMWDKYSKAPDRVKLQVRTAYEQFRNSISEDALTVGDMRRLRDNAVSEMTGGRNLMTLGRESDSIPLSDLTPRSRKYVLHFEEWFAEQTAKWATTSEKPLSRVDKFFKELGASVRKLIDVFRSTPRKSSAEAVPAMQAWLDSLMKSPQGKFAHDMLDQLDLDTKRKNADALDRDGTPEVVATPATASTVGGRNIIDSLPPSVRAAGDASAAHADRMNKFYEWMTSLPQIADLNKHIRPLQIYREIVQTMNVEKNNIMGAAKETLNQWKMIRDPKQQIAIGKFIEDYMQGNFKLVDDGIIRRPTSTEHAALVSKHKLSEQSLRLFDKLVKDFDALLEQYRSLLLADAARIKDPIAEAAAAAAIHKRVDALRERPYFPAMRFGKYTITVYDSNNNVRHFEQTESLKKQRQIKEALEKSPDLLPGDRVRTGEVPKDATPLLGMPPGLIDLMADRLALSTTQRGMLDQLRFDYAPSQSFRHQFRQKDLTPGYSTDFQRAYAHFFFHGANHLTRVKWVDGLRDQIREVKQSSVDLNDANKRDHIANYMSEHLTMLVDPKPDFAALRGLMFHWYLGFNPASATLNLSQTPLMTFPHLASKFGDVSSVQALLKASADLNNFYKKGTVIEAAKTAPPGPEGAPFRAMAEAVREGVISETQAHELAAVSEGRNMLRAFGSKNEEHWHNFSEKSSWMFEMAEQYNRRIAFRAAWDLAMRDPNAKYVQDVVRDNPLQYQRLRDQDWSHQEASAFAAAKDSVEKSQFVYAPYARPKFMWGRKGALFIFKSFVQNTLFNLWSNPSMAARHLLILGTLGGLMGLPGAEDINGILKALGWHLFGKDFDLEDQARKFAVDVLDGNISPDVLLHGMSVKGFGIPAVMNALGTHAGLPKFFPTLDRHGSIGMGNILPVEPGKLFGPTKDVKAQGFTQLQRASGAGFSNVFALYEFLNSQDSRASMKKWEKIMPRALGNISHGFRYFRDGEETNKAGNAVVKFDVNDTEHMAEILARTMGYQPRRLTGEWEMISAKQEQAVYWDLRKQILLRQFGEVVKTQDAAGKEEVLKAVRNYNSSLPTEARAKAISAQTLKDSVMQRMRVRGQQERNIPTSKQNYELFKSLDKYFPDGRPTGQIHAVPVK